MEGTRGRCLGSLGVETSAAAFCSTRPGAGQPLEPTANGRQRARGGGFGEAAIVERAQVGADVGVLDVLRRSVPVVVLGHPGGESFAARAGRRAGCGRMRHARWPARGGSRRPGWTGVGSSWRPCRLSAVVSHPCGKNKDAARMGHPASCPCTGRATAGPSTPSVRCGGLRSLRMTVRSGTGGHADSSLSSREGNSIIVSDCARRVARG